MRRFLTIGVAGAMLIALVAVAGLFPVPYVSEGPGPTENTLGTYDGTDVIVVTGAETYATTGHLDLTTVSVTSADTKLDLLTALRGWLDPDVAIVPRSTVYRDDVPPAQVRQQNAEQMQTSQQSAVVAALRALDYPVPASIVVNSIAEGAPALGHLEAGDAILAVDGAAVASREDVVAGVTAREPGDEVVFTIDRDGRQSDVSVTTALSSPANQAPDQPPRTYVGIDLASGYSFPFSVEIALGEDIGGPSAGLMFALGVADKLTPGALTGGAYVAGTGTIDDDGLVGPIGGIQQKILGARNVGATIFLVPAENCAAAVAAAVDGVRLVRVNTLAGASDALEALAAGAGDVPACT